ncbi:MAG: hypothetical protein ACR2NX_03160 [Chthoniobacterales bacterium]
MNNQTSRFHLGLAIVLCAVVSATGYARAAELNATDRQFLSTYEKVHPALAKDDMAAAKMAGTELGDEGQAIATAKDLETARAEFGKVSERAVTLAEGQGGYYVAKCPMVKKSWVQTSTEIKNPYNGKEMLTCGVIKK